MTTQHENWLKLADELEKLCCAETEGKFFDLVTDSIGTILSALRIAAPHVEVREALAEAIAVFEGMCDDEIDVELLPRLRAALSPPSERETGK